MNLLLMGLGTQEIFIIALIILVLFGGKKIPELMKGLGKGIKSFKDGMKEIEDEKNPHSGIILMNLGPASSRLLLLQSYLL